jgi:hypothetical protein
MLIIEDKPSDLLHTERIVPDWPVKTRINSDELRTKLAEILEKGEKDPEYFTKPLAAMPRSTSSLRKQVLRIGLSKKDLLQRRQTLERSSSSRSVL